jgi:hypothetical protein
MVVYKDGNGAMLNILGSKRVKKMEVYKPQRGGRSGIVRRRKVSDATKRRRGYIGKDRAFILRFVNSGTDFRQAETYQNANRGRIKQKEFFGTSADAAMNAAGARLGAKVEKMIGDISV